MEIFEKSEDIIENVVEKNSNKKSNADAFVNWSIKTKNGNLTSDYGFTIFTENPEYPNEKERMLVALAKKNGGTVELDMRVRIQLNTKLHGPNQVVSIEDILLG